jgi:hypothetical protein
MKKQNSRSKIRAPAEHQPAEKLLSRMSRNDRVSRIANILPRLEALNAVY